jgi:hypothetical protein
MATNEGTCGYNQDATTGKKLTTPGGIDNTFLKETIQSILEKKKKKKKKKSTLCPKGQAYRKRRLAAGEKNSAYLNLRASGICSGKWPPKKKKKTNEYLLEDDIRESLKDWVKEKWVRINTSGNITGPCGTMKDKNNPSRCLPEKKAKSLTKSQRAATAKKKKAAGKSGKQYIKNTKKATVKK